MNYIYDEDGNIIRKSHNLRGIRDHSGRVQVEKVTIVKLSDDVLWEAILLVHYTNGDNASVAFTSWHVLKSWVSRWRNAYGAKLELVDAASVTDGGVVLFDNPFLKN